MHAHFSLNPRIRFYISLLSVCCLFVAQSRAQERWFEVSQIIPEGYPNTFERRLGFDVHVEGDYLFAFSKE